MLYHYTSLQALEGILRDAPSDRGFCLHQRVEVMDFNSK